MNLVLPKYMRVGNIDEFLKNFEFVFNLQNQMLQNVSLDASKINDPTLLALLLTYKVIDYSYSNFCFKKLDLIVNDEFIEAIEMYGFKSLFDAFRSNKDITEKEYKKLNVKIADNFIIAPQALLRDTDFSRTYLNKVFLPKIQSYYEDEKTINLIFTCFSEIILNFWEHAVTDTKSILVASGKKNNIEIACADTGGGLISTLRAAGHVNQTNEALITKAFEKGFTSQKNTNHMGYGLWIVNELINLNNGRLFVFSEGVSYCNNYGKVKINRTGYWKGTIVYLSIPLSNPKTICDIVQLNEDSIKHNLKINFL